jgi:hypothetical protein
VDAATALRAAPWAWGVLVAAELRVGEIEVGGPGGLLERLGALTDPARGTGGCTGLPGWW